MTNEGRGSTRSSLKRNLNQNFLHENYLHNRFPVYFGYGIWSAENTPCICYYAGWISLAGVVYGRRFSIDDQ
jgi:hypothetical protein